MMIDSGAWPRDGVRDVRLREFAEEAHRQSEVVASAEKERDDEAFVDGVSLGAAQE